MLNFFFFFLEDTIEYDFEKKIDSVTSRLVKIFEHKYSNTC